MCSVMEHLFFFLQGCELRNKAIMKPGECGMHSCCFESTGGLCQRGVGQSDASSTSFLLLAQCSLAHIHKNVACGFPTLRES